MAVTVPKQMPKSTKLFLWATVLLGLGYLVSASGLVRFSAEAMRLIAVLFVVCGVYGLPLSLFISRFVNKPLGAWWKALIVTMLLLMLGSGLGFASSYVLRSLPTYYWIEHERPPEPVTDLVATLPIGMFSGGIYARTTAGGLYLHRCEHETCGWTEVDQLPSPSDKTDYWSGMCYDGSQEPDGFVIKPLAPGKVIDSIATRYCGPDYHMDTYFILLEDSSLWSWGKSWSGLDFIPLLGWALVGGVVAVIWGALKR